MKGITSGLEPRRYAEGDLVEEDKGFFGNALDFAKKYGILANPIYGAYKYYQDPEETMETYKKAHDFGKEYIFDYTDPYEYATLPLYLAGPAGAAANRSIKAARIANKINKAGKTEKILDNKATKGILNIGGPIAGISTDIALDPEIDFGDVVDAGKYYANQAVDYAKDIFTNDAVDDAQEDLDEVNKKETDDKKDKDDASLSKEDRMMKGIAALMEAYGESQSGDGASLPGGMIRGTAIDTPEIRRYQGGGIADMMPQEPMMMAGGGMVPGVNGEMVPGYGLGSFIKKKITDTVKTIVKKTKSEKKPDTKKKTDTKKKKDTKEETGITDKPPVKESIMPPEFKYIAGVPYVGGKKVLEKLGGAGGIGRGIVRGGVYGTAGTVGYNYLDPFGKKTEVEYQDSSGPAKVKIEEPDSLRDFHLQNSMARAQEAGRDTPNFMDYLASFPKSYTDKLGSDPEFAQQMMAGFLAMMKPTEGFVPRNAFVDFGEASMAERARQEGEVPDQIKMMERFKDDPGLLDAFREYTRSTEPFDATTEASNRSQVFAALQKQIFGDDFDKDDDIPINVNTGQKANEFSVYAEFLKLGGDSSALVALKDNYAQP